MNTPGLRYNSRTLGKYVSAIRERDQTCYCGELELASKPQGCEATADCDARIRNWAETTVPGPESGKRRAKY